MKNKSPLSIWFVENRWTPPLIADKTGISKFTVITHIKGLAWPREKAINAYKTLGVPAETIREHLSWMIDKA